MPTRAPRLREEVGETTGRLHDHFLLAGLPPDNVNRQTCHWCNHQWEHTIQGGFARVRVFDPQLDGVGYTLKGLGGDDAYASSTRLP